MSDLIDNQPIREAVLAHVARGHTLAEIAKSADMYYNGENRRGDPTWLKRAVGLATEHSGGKVYTRRRINYHLAVRIADACNADYVDVGV